MLYISQRTPVIAISCYTNLMHIAIQGQAGSFHEQAAQQWFGPQVDTVPCTTFRDVFHAHATGQAEGIVVAVENTLYGTINEPYHYLEACPLPIIGEVRLAIEQMLITLPGARLADITEVYSHPVALAQCQRFLAAGLPHAVQNEFFDTAGAVAYIKAIGDPHKAAIAGWAAATLHHLPILRRSIQDSHDNITRFIILTPGHAPARANRATLVITTNHQPGALLEVLHVFAAAGINISSLQSQPIVGQPWQYKFFLVVDSAGAPLKHALRAIEQSDHTVRLLGEYRAG